MINHIDGPAPWYKMKRKRPKHLPNYKQAELDQAVQTILAHHPVEMIILFGSHARGDWVDDRYTEDHITYEYRSDFDILVVTDGKSDERDVEYDRDLQAALQPRREDATRINIIVHSIQHVNQMLAERRFFFMDILKEGYLLHDTGRFKLARPPQELPTEVMLRHAEEYYGEWMESGERFFAVYAFTLENGWEKMAAFQLHQSAERFITCVILVYTGYRPKEHDLRKLLHQAAGFDPRYAGVFPEGTDEEKHLFDLLRRAYVDARYSKRYRITGEELQALSGRVETLKALTTEVAQRRIDDLRRQVAPD